MVKRKNFHQILHNQIKFFEQFAMSMQHFFIWIYLFSGKIDTRYWYWHIAKFYVKSALILGVCPSLIFQTRAELEPGLYAFLAHPYLIHLSVRMTASALAFGMVYFVLDFQTIRNFVSETWVLHHYLKNKVYTAKNRDNHKSELAFGGRTKLPLRLPLGSSKMEKK